MLESVKWINFTSSISTFRQVGQITHDLVLECQKGSRQAQKAIYTILAPKMYAVCLRYTRNQTEAEDCLQDAFVKVFTRISDFRHEGVFEGWVRRIVVNTVIEQFRRKTPIHQFDSIDHLPESPYDIDYDHDTAGLNAEFLMRLVQEMPQQYQIVFSLYAIDGYSHDEIAQQLGISLGTSKSNLSRGRKWLQKRLAQIENIDNKTFAANASNR